MKLHTYKTVLIGLAIAVGVGVIYFSLDPSNYYFVKLAFVGDGTIPQQYIICYVKSTIEKIIDGQVKETQQSKFLQTNPLFSLVDAKSGKEVSRFDDTPKMRCDWNPTPRVGSVATMTVKSSDLVLNVYSKDDKNTKVNTHDDRKISGGLQMSDNKEIKLATFSVKPYQIADDLPEGTYNSLQEFRISGNVVLLYSVKYKDKSPIEYEYKIKVPEDSIRTWSEMKVVGITNSDDKKEEKTCSTGYIMIENSCQPAPENEPKGNEKGATPSFSFDINGILNEFLYCGSTGNFGCLAQQKFAGIWIVIVIIMILIGAVFSGRRNKEFG